LRDCIDQVNRIENTITFRCQGNSMLPVIEPGVLLSVQPEPFRENLPNPGELIVFKRGAGVVCHRYYGTMKLGRKRYIIEKGDRNRIAGLVRIDCYVGKATAVNNISADKFCKAVKKPSNLLLLLGLLRERWYRFIEKK
jgi:hypothetical protein